MLNVIRGAVRPIVTVGSVAATIAFIGTGTPIPQEWWIFVTGIGAWWFSDRSTAKKPEVTP